MGRKGLPENPVSGNDGEAGRPWGISDELRGPQGVSVQMKEVVESEIW